MRLSAAGFAAFVLVLGVSACGTGGGSSPGPGGGNTARPSASPTAAPTATATATPAPTPTPVGPPTPAFNNWPTYGYDNARDGFNPNTTAITPSSIAKLHLAWKVTVPDQKTQTQPILATNIGTHTGVLIVGGATGRTYEYDALTGQVLWADQLGSAILSCPGQVGPLGIGGTAVYDPSAQAFYIGSNLNSGVANTQTQVFINKINILNGQIEAKVNIAPSPYPGEVNLTHTSLTLANGMLYAGTGSTCDISSWRGRIVAVNEASMTLVNTFYPVWNQTQVASPSPAAFSGGGVWGWGGVSVDSGGNIWGAVGNLDTQTNPGPQPPFVQHNKEFDDYGEHLLELTPNLSTVMQSNYPGFVFNNQMSSDLDISGTPVLGQPLGCHEMAAVQGKSGYLYIYDTTGIGSGPVASVKFTSSSFNDPNLGNPAFSPLTGMFYAAVSSAVAGGVTPAPGMIALKPCDSALPTVAWTTAFGADSMLSGTPHSMPTVTAGGVVFLGTPCKVDVTEGCSGQQFGGALWALDASSGAVLNNGRPIFTTPKAIRMGAVVDGDWVFLLDEYGDMYGYTIDPNFSPTSSARVRARNS
jgi:hypothetical protein